MTQPPPQNATQEETTLPKIIFYDVQHTLPPPFTSHSSWSPFTTRVALALKYRNLPYTRVPTSYPDIAGLLSSKDVPPALDDEGKVDSVPYTLPAIELIYSNENGTETRKITIMDSTPISTTLESLTPPSTTHPSLFPQGRKSHDQVSRIGAALKGARKQIVPFIPAILDDRGSEYFNRTRSAVFGKPLEEVRIEANEEAEREGGLERVLGEALRGVAGVYLEQSGQGEGDGGVFLGGSKVPSYGDFVFVAVVQWWRCARGVEVVERALEGCEGGVLKKVFDACEGLLD